MRLSNKITAVDAHACGEPGRVITGGVSDVPGNTMFEKKLTSSGTQMACASSCCGNRAAIPRCAAT